MFFFGYRTSGLSGESGKAQSEGRWLLTAGKATDLGIKHRMSDWMSRHEWKPPNDLVGSARNLILLEINTGMSQLWVLKDTLCLLQKAIIQRAPFDTSPRQCLPNSDFENIVNLRGNASAKQGIFEKDAGDVVLWSKGWQDGEDSARWRFSWLFYLQDEGWNGPFFSMVGVESQQKMPRTLSCWPRCGPTLLV